MNPKKQKSTVSSKERTSDFDAGLFPIVGIGASAGGLEALEQFLRNVPENTGMAYVVVQHLDPTQKGLLPELLQRVSSMKVFQVKDRMVVAPNQVYVIPPNTSLSIVKGIFHLSDPIEARGLRLPVDIFLRSLADDRRDQAIGVILSGMGSDGSIGIRSVKENNGIVMVQEPSTAKYDSMPRNAIDSVQVDIVAPANELPAKLLAFMHHIPVIKSNLENEIKDQSSLEKIIILLRAHTGNNFSLYKKNTIYRRIERRMGVHKIDKIVSYVSFLRENPKELAILFKELLIGVTNFFRDSAVWEKLNETIIPDMLESFPPGTVFRAWIPGCSTGEEAFSLGMVFKEAVEKTNPQGSYSLQIFATDLDTEAIDIARKGVFPANISADVSPHRLSRFFSATEEGYRVNTEIREMVVFAQHSIIMHPPFTKIDILSCRNLLIYLDTELQVKLLGLFFYSLNPEGVLILGSAETPGSQGALFTPLFPKLKIYRRSGNALIPELFDFPSSFSRNNATKSENQQPAKVTQNIQTLADQLLLQTFAPAGVLVTENGDIIYISGHTGKYLEPAVGKANMNIFAMLRDGLRQDFAVAFSKAVLKKESVVLRNLKVGTNGGSQTLNITIQWIGKPEPLNGMVMIIFKDVASIEDALPAVNQTKKILSSGRQKQLEEEMKHMREEIQNTLEEMQSSQEELKSTNEELQSTNEELQSTNEELTTSKEEMQSLNEELQTVNAELQSKVDDYSRVSNDMKNLLNSTDIATLFLDKELNIRRFTNQATKIFKLIKSDIGRRFTDQTSDLIYPELAADGQDVLKTLVFIEKQIPSKDGRWFTVRIMPYRTFDDRIDGLVITFINMSSLRHVEEQLQEADQLKNLLLNSSSDVIIRLSPEWKILEFNSEAERFFGIKYPEVINKNYFQLFSPASLRSKGEKCFNKLLNKRMKIKCPMKVITAGGTETLVEWSVNVLTGNLDKATGMILTYKINL